MPTQTRRHFFVNGFDLRNGSEFPILDGDFGLKDAIAQRPGAHHFGADRKFSVGSLDMQDLFIVDPDADVSGIDSDLEVVPLSVFEVAIAGGLVFACVVAVDAADSDQSATPTAADE